MAVFIIDYDSIVSGFLERTKPGVLQPAFTQLFNDITQAGHTFRILFRQDDNPGLLGQVKTSQTLFSKTIVQFTQRDCKGLSKAQEVYFISLEPSSPRSVLQKTIPLFEVQGLECVVFEFLDTPQASLDALKLLIQRLFRGEGASAGVHSVPPSYFSPGDRTLTAGAAQAGLGAVGSPIGQFAFFLRENFKTEGAFPAGDFKVISFIEPRQKLVGTTGWRECQTLIQPSITFYWSPDTGMLRMNPLAEWFPSPVPLKTKSKSKAWCCAADDRTPPPSRPASAARFVRSPDDVALMPNPFAEQQGSIGRAGMRLGVAAPMMNPEGVGSFSLGLGSFAEPAAANPPSRSPSGFAPLPQSIIPPMPKADPRSVSSKSQSSLSHRSAAYWEPASQED